MRIRGVPAGIPLESVHGLNRETRRQSPCFRSSRSRYRSSWVNKCLRRHLGVCPKVPAEISSCQEFTQFDGHPGSEPSNTNELTHTPVGRTLLPVLSNHVSKDRQEGTANGNAFQIRPNDIFLIDSRGKLLDARLETCFSKVHFFRKLSHGHLPRRPHQRPPAF